jgi:hypothetical protein
MRRLVVAAAWLGAADFACAASCWAAIAFTCSKNPVRGCCFPLGFVPEPLPSKGGIKGQLAARTAQNEKNNRLGDKKKNRDGAQK